jgi:hypothetical protein
MFYQSAVFMTDSSNFIYELQFFIDINELFVGVICCLPQ